MGGVNNVSGSLAFFVANLAALLVQQLPRESQLSWGWRVPFLVAAPIAAISILLRRYLPETEAFKEAQKERQEHDGEARPGSDEDSQDSKRNPADIVSHEQSHDWPYFYDLRAILLSIVVIAAVNSCNYFPVYLASWLRKAAGLSAGSALGLTAISKIVQLVMTFPVSHAGDRWGATRTMMLGGIACALAMVPSLLIVAQVAEISDEHSSLGGDIGVPVQEFPMSVYAVAILLLGIMLPVFTSFYLVPSNLYMTSLFPSARRGRGAGFALGLASVVGGLTPAIAAALAEHNVIFPGVFISFLVVPSLTAVLWSRRAAAKTRLQVYQRPWLF